MRWIEVWMVCLVASSFLLTEQDNALLAQEPKRPNVVLVMADDMGYAQTSYYGHSLLRTPELDRLARGGLRLDQFYAASAVCSPTRASVLTGRSPERTGVPSHGHALRLQERSVAVAIREAGYVTGHFGKWHLDGLRGPGVPILASDRFHPGRFGFDVWLSVTNFFDRDPILSRRGKFEGFQGDSSEVIVEEMLDFAKRSVRSKQPFFAVVWYGTPHLPFRASPEDIQSLVDAGEDADDKLARQQLVDRLDQASLNQCGELVAMDRSLGTLREGLSKLGALEQTLIWFCSDNGGLAQVKPSSTAPLRGHKSQLYEGGLRVPCVVHWPEVVRPNRISRFPACTTDIAPTLLDLLQLPEQSLLSPTDGISLASLLTERDWEETSERNEPIGFRFRGGSAVVDNQWKLLRLPKKKAGKPQQELYHLGKDIGETTNLAKKHPEVLDRLSGWLDDWNQSVAQSIAGKDYSEGHVDPNHPSPKFWTEEENYEPFFDEWRQRPEYEERLREKASS
ncbi:sulfatase family protein [Rhodopirellula halodulae]|uniref:sulfatase family protein n=1 Tax=Rhodopirellula halodulae TaxID=2894198 RepID=UPI001E55C3C1|nr:sulfatase-like hydrolase/transferase [Rhodopirellula sp. JC737]MCC9657467.1 sulfatase-like hydrolase/transferase [Rhodopirellula sp. JC737]